MARNKNSLLHLENNKTVFSPLLIYILSVLALAVFLNGFFPLKYSSKTEARDAETDNLVLSRYVNKLAFIVIDALRCDFVVRDDGQKLMPFTLSSILNQNACYMNVKAHSPTVTLPRLKAITSGSFSTFIDVILNFMTPAFEADNLINIAASNGLKMVFYGDDTWLKLFPGSFIRSEGTHSFYTFDYYEVDSNVTRNIDSELKRDDWDIIILHYLGLDHIGHTEGPNSPLIKSKLLEMDNIIFKFSEHFKMLEKNKGIKTMLILTSDHGMKDSGSHGGVTYPEITVPLVSIGNPCLPLSGWPEDHTPLQIDIAPTLSAVLGLPIPASNMGKLIPGLLHHMDKEDVLKSLEINRLAFRKFTSTRNEDLEMNLVKNELDQWLSSKEKNEEMGANITRKYFDHLNNKSQEMISNSDFNLFCLFAGIICLWVFLLLLLSEFWKRFSKPRNFLQWFFVVGSVLHAISLFSTSFIEEEHQTWYFLWTTFYIVTLVTAFKNAQTNWSFALWVVLALAHRVLRKLNQTGDKWAFLPDIKLFLYTENGRFWLFYLFLLGIGMIFICAAVEKLKISYLLLYGICLASVICYRIANGIFKFQYLSFYPSSKGLVELLVFWTSLSIFAMLCISNQKPFYLVWLAFISFYLRPHNVILLPVQVIISNRLHKVFNKPEDSSWNNIAHIWLGNVFYFYQGNGNSLSNVDVAAGFVGIQTYNPAYSGFMIAAHCFNGHILSFILSPKLDLCYAISRLTSLCIYCTGLLVQLNHLFIWTVFSPKLLFEASLTVLFLVLMTLNYFFNSNK